jgi:hypothetical protein
VKNLKKQALKTIWRMLFALVLVAGYAALTVSLSPEVASADGGDQHGDNHEVTFTKWLTTFPNMVGVVGGVVGVGTYAGEILNIGTVGDITRIEALYHINGSRHSFSAHVFVTQHNLAGRALITGIVTSGWQMGARVHGEYRVMLVCPIATPGNGQGTKCFQGTLHIQRGDRD